MHNDNLIDSPGVEGVGTNGQASDDGNVQGQVGHGAPCVLLPALGRDGIADVCQGEGWWR